MTLKEYRESHKVKQIQLASLAGIHHSNLSTIENGYYKVSRETTNKIIRAYELLGIEAKDEIEKICLEQNLNLEKRK